MNIYLIRHGESVSNINNIFAGQLDSPLSDLGNKQAERILEYFKDKKIDEIYSSSLSRAYNTIKPTANFFDVKINLDDRLKEINGGDWQGRRYDEIEKNSYQFREVWKKDLKNCVCDNGESVKDCANRVFTAFKDIVLNSKSNNLVITSHAFAIRTILSNIIYDDISSIDKISFLVNAGISIVEFNSGKFTVKELLVTKHLGDLITKLPKNV